MACLARIEAEMSCVVMAVAHCANDKAVEPELRLWLQLLATKVVWLQI